jgi:hypothetical protein
MKERPEPGEYGNLAREAVITLARMDADRLEELVRSCRGLDPDPSLAAMELRRELVVLARVLEATRSNAIVLRRLGEFRDPDLEYRCAPENGWVALRSGNGHDSIGV